MTIKELLEYLKHIKRIVPEVLIVENRKLSHSEICDVIEDIISKVKQLKDRETPKKIKKSRIEYRFWCPKCGTFVDKFDKYCRGCGQRIVWSEEKE